MNIRCPHCGARLTAPDHARGRTGRCSTCRSNFPLPPAEGGSTPGPAAPPATIGAGDPAGRAPIGVPRPRPEPIGGGADAYDVEPIDDSDGLDPGGGDDGLAAAPEPPAPINPPRAGSFEPPKKSRRQRLEELEDIRAEGRRYLLQIRLMFLGLGLLILASNVYMYLALEETLTGGWPAGRDARRSRARRPRGLASGTGPASRRAATRWGEASIPVGRGGGRDGRGGPGPLRRRVGAG